MAGPDLLPLLAGLSEAFRPTCPECAAEPGFLAANSGVLTMLTGPQGTPTAFSTMRMLGITSAADRETAVAFARYWFNEGYEPWLSVEPERKIPLRQGTTSEPTRFSDAWAAAPLGDGEQTLADLYGEALPSQMQESVAAAARWGIPRGYGSLVTTLYEELTFAVVLQEMLSGYFDTEATLFEAYNRVIDLIPNYPYDRVERTPTATP
jgi:multiple sugar transport system substrate-binding protein